MSDFIGTEDLATEPENNYLIRIPFTKIIDWVDYARAWHEEKVARESGVVKANWINSAAKKRIEDQLGGPISMAPINPGGYKMAGPEDEPLGTLGFEGEFNSDSDYDIDSDSD